jgi:hypothetical protein
MADRIIWLVCAQGDATYTTLSEDRTLTMRPVAVLVQHSPRPHPAFSEPCY